MVFRLLQKTTQMCVGRQIQVLGSYWTGSMSNEETNSLYKCTVLEYHALHKWDAGDTPSQVMELQEMGVDGQGSRETGGSADDRIFFMKYPMLFLQLLYNTCQVKAPREWLIPTSHTYPRGRLLSSITIRGRNHTNKTDFFNRTEDSDTDMWTRLRSWVLSEEESVVWERETSLSFITITQSVIYQD